ncbi:hypothetical protein ACH4PR_51565 [Streptomyces mirabilis]|uniref:hypothetical protein n=1 Tax=Streptomyces mirabilis TaxID=68239 RepID=UPI00378A7BC6
MARGLGRLFKVDPVPGALDKHRLHRVEPRRDTTTHQLVGDEPVCLPAHDQHRAREAASLPTVRMAGVPAVGEVVDDLGTQSRTADHQPVELPFGAARPTVAS